MRPPNKPRSRNKNNRRNNNTGNSLNRVFDSAGPQGRVRGTPAQVIEKYQSLAHDSLLSDDRVATENFQQHAEHYIRLMNESQRQMVERREAQDQAQERHNHDRQIGGGRDNPPHANAPADPGASEQPIVAGPVVPNPVAPSPVVPDVVETVGNDSSGNDGGLVATPEESKPKPPRQRRPRATKPAEPKTEAGQDANTAE